MTDLVDPIIEKLGVQAQHNGMLLSISDKDLTTLQIYLLAVIAKRLGEIAEAE